MNRRVQIFVEKLRQGIPRTAREFAGFPVVYEEREVTLDEAIIRNETIMPDGRPMRAWWFEIQEARKRKPDLEARELRVREQFLLLGIAKWAIARDPLNCDSVIRFEPMLADTIPDFGKCCKVVESAAPEKK